MNFSIIVPHYNDLEGLGRLLASIPRRDDIEIIIVDDNSHIDNTVLDAFFLEHTELNIHFYINNQGTKSAGTCRNIALGKVTAKYVLFADADDYFVVNAFDFLDVELLLAPSSDIYYFKPTSQCLITGELSDRHVRYVDLIDQYLKTGDQTINAKFSVPWSKLYLTKFLIDNNCKFDEVIASNDVMFSLKAGFLAKKINVSENTIYCVTRGKGSLTVNKTKQNQVSRLLIAIRESEFINENKIAVEQNSVVGLIRDNIKFIDIKLVALIFKNYTKGNLIFFPRSYVQYIKNPALIIKRLIKREKSSIHDDRYINN